MDLWLYFGIGFPATIWLAIHDAPDEFEVRHCNELGSAFESLIPILFKQCIPPKYTPSDFSFFPDTHQNIFPVCAEEVTRNFQFLAADGSYIDIVERVPCSGATLEQKLQRFQDHPHNLSQTYADVHTYMMDDSEVEQVTRQMQRKGIVPHGFQFQGEPIVITHFLSMGVSNVYYFHSHPDRFFSFGFGDKEWQLINPKHHDKFARQWSGNAMVLTQEFTEAPRVKVLQERGDILCLPPWWIHKTVMSGQKTGIGVNIHMFAKGQFLGIAAGIMQRLGVTHWFYKNAY